MSLFYSRRPRRFNHRLIYSDERKERLKDIEECAKRELGMSVDGHGAPEQIRGAFPRTSKHQLNKERKTSTHTLTTNPLTTTAAIIALLLFAHWLLTGRFPI